MLFLSIHRSIQRLRGIISKNCQYLLSLEIQALYFFGLAVALVKVLNVAERFLRNGVIVGAKTLYG